MDIDVSAAVVVVITIAIVEPTLEVSWLVDVALVDSSEVVVERSEVGC